MATKDSNMECTVTCWGIAAFAGLVAMVMLYWMADFSALQAIFTGGLIGTLLGVVLSLTVCTQQTALADLAAEEKPAARYAREAEERRAARVAATMGAQTAPVAPAATAPTAVATPSEAGGSTAAAPAAAPVAAPAAAPAAAASTEQDATPEAEAAEDGFVGERSAGMLAGPRAGGKDDLKRISGVGPKLEGTLNDLGVYHFDQVAKFTKEDIAWVDGNLRFKGRIERDDWMGQAAVLAAGGETEFSKKKS